MLSSSLFDFLVVVFVVVFVVDVYWQREFRIGL
jgi:hypothetical protein